MGNMASVIDFHRKLRFFMVIWFQNSNSAFRSVFHGKRWRIPIFRSLVTIFHGSRLPERATPVGYAALIDAFALAVPMPRTLSAIGPRHKQYAAGRLAYLHTAPCAAGQPGRTPDLRPQIRRARSPRPESAVPRHRPRADRSIVQATPTGTYARRSWFLYEWLLGTNARPARSRQRRLRHRRRSGPAMGGGRKDIDTPPRQKQPARHARLLSR